MSYAASCGGLWTVCAWVNHADSRGPNSLDMWVTEDGRSFVRHHLIDFNAILGAGAIGPRAYPTGSEYYVDFGVMSGRSGVLGLRSFAWEPSADPHMLLGRLHRSQDRLIRPLATGLSQPGVR